MTYSERRKRVCRSVEGAAAPADKTCGHKEATAFTNGYGYHAQHVPDEARCDQAPRHRSDAGAFRCLETLDIPEK